MPRQVCRLDLNVLNDNQGIGQVLQMDQHAQHAQHASQALNQAQFSCPLDLPLIAYPKPCTALTEKT